MPTSDFSRTETESLLAASDMPITLQVGEQRFVTTRYTLTEKSGFFAGLLSENWDNKQADGSYFIDADPDLFKHILTYLRRGVLPVFYDKTKGHDHALYMAVGQEANYFQISQLVEWIEKKRYLQTVRITTSIEVLSDNKTLETADGDDDIECHPGWEDVDIYICPRDIPVHRGQPECVWKSV